MINLAVSGVASINTAVRDNTVTAGFSVYPSPAANKVYIKHPRSSSNTNIALYSLHGVKVAEWKATPNTILTSVDVQALPQGQYFIYYSSGKDKVVLKCIIIH